MLRPHSRRAPRPRGTRSHRPLAVAVALTATLTLVLVALLPLAGCGPSAEDVLTEQLDVVADLMIGILIIDGDLVAGAVPAKLSDDDPELFANAQDPAQIDVTRERDGDALVVSFTGGDSLTIERIEESEGSATLVATFPGESSTFTLVETDDGWRVTEIDGTDVADVLEFALMSDEGLAEVDRAIELELCFTGQMAVETAFGVRDLEGLEVSTSHADYVDFFDEIPYCPVPESQYSETGSTEGFFDGLDENGIVAPCSVHGYYDAE